MFRRLLVPVFLASVLRSAFPCAPDPFAEIDRHADNAPGSAEKSVKSLSRYLVRPAKNDEEKARAIFRWVARNISYDTRGYFTGNAGPSSPNSVLQNRTAVCEGFSGLFKSLGREAGLEIETIGGYAKGYDSSVGERFSGPPNHAWNAVRINGTWRLMDATWGSGYMDENGRYLRSFNGFFFFTPPEKLIYTHFPENPEWQLLPQKVTLGEFEKMAFLRPGFFQNGLELDSHQSSDIECADTVRVTLRAQAETMLLAQLIRNGGDLGSDLTFVQKDGRRAIILAAFPSTGTYILRIFARPKSEKGMADWVMDYRIRNRGRGGETPVFPETYQDFLDRDVFLEGPVRGRLKAGKSFRFSVRIPGAEKAAVSTGKRWVELKKSGQWFRGDVKAAKGEIFVYAKFPRMRKYSGLLKYTGTR